MRHTKDFKNSGRENKHSFLPKVKVKIGTELSKLDFCTFYMQGWEQIINKCFKLLVRNQGIIGKGTLLWSCLPDSFKGET